MRFLRFLFVLFFVCVVKSDNVFRFGGVLSTVATEEQDTTTMLEAKNGYGIYIDAVNELNNGRGFYVAGKEDTPGFYFKYDFIWREDNSDALIHAEKLQEIITEEKVHFVGGSHPTYAAEEMQICSENNVINYQCCVGPDELYEMDFKTVYGVPVSNREYTKMTIRTLSFHDLRTMAIIYEETNAFTRTTCEAAQAYADEVGAVQAKHSTNYIRTFNISNVETSYFEEVAREAKKRGVEAVVACVFPDQGKLLVDAFHDIEYPLKAFFLTTGPTKKTWVNDFDPPFRADNLLSAAQWHRDMKYPDDFFGSTQEYANSYETKFKVPPTYNAAAASAVGLSLTQAIQDAFIHCDISRTKGDVEVLLYDPSAIQCDDTTLGKMGYDRVMKALAEIDMETFFGRIKFNYYRRNVGLDPVTTQVIKHTHANGVETRKIEAVLPLGYATQLMIYPAENMYSGDCQPGYYVGPDAFDKCQPCEPGDSSSTINSEHCDKCPTGEWNGKKAQSHCVHCPEGTVTEVRGATMISECKCRIGYYNIEQTTGVECQKCPFGATCAGGTELPVSLPGFWANETKRTEIYECDPPDICLGNSTCEKGYEGKICSQCKPEYFSMLKDCYRCVSSFTIISLFTLLLFGWYFINVTVSNSVTSLEMILGWAQLANIIGDVSLNWTPMVRTMFGVANILDFDVDILEPSCIFKNWGYRENFVTQLSLPFVMSIMAGVGYLGSAAAYVAVQRRWIRLEGKRQGVLSIFFDVPEDKDQLQKKWDATIATFLSSVDVTYVTIAKYCMDVFKCENIAGELVLSEDPSVICGNGEHKALIALAVSGLIFYVIGYLVFTSWNIIHLQQLRGFSNETNLKRYGFIYEKYELDYFFTPIIVLVRKLLFVLVLVYVNNPAFQVGALTIIITASLMVHVYTAPYVDSHCDVLLAFLLLALMFEAFGGLMFYSDNLPKANRLILEWIIIVSLIVMLVAFAMIFCLEVRKKFHVRYVKKVHKKYVRQGSDFSSFFRMAQRLSRQIKRSGNSCGSIGSLTSSMKTEKREVSYELLDTFKPAFVYSSLRLHPELVKEWDKITNMLKGYMSDQADVSYLSLNPVAKFWRKFVNKFPEIVDFLAVADDDTREKFKHVARVLYREFYVSNKVSPLPLMKVLNWRDYAPMAQWLAIAPKEERQAFNELVIRMLKLNGKKELADVFKARLESGGPLPSLHRRLDHRKLSRRQSKFLDEMSGICDPFYNSIIERPNRFLTADSSANRSSELAPDDTRRTSDPTTRSTSEISVIAASGPLGEAASSEGTEEYCRLSRPALRNINERSMDRMSRQSSQNNRSVCFADEVRDMADSI